MTVHSSAQRKKLRAAWYGMLVRHAGLGRGIARPVCDEWLRCFESFASHVGPPPSRRHVLCLRNPVNGFQPGNVFWGTWIDRQQRVSHARQISFRGKRLSISGWARELGVLPETIRRRLETGASLQKVLSKRRWPPNRAPRSALGKQPSSRFVGVSYRPKDAAWEAKIKVGGVLYYLGIYHVESEAAGAVTRARELIHLARRSRQTPTRIRELLTDLVVRLPRRRIPERKARIKEAEEPVSQT